MSKAELQVVGWVEAKRAKSRGSKAARSPTSEFSFLASAAVDRIAINPRNVNAYGVFIVVWTKRACSVAQHVQYQVAETAAQARPLADQLRVCGALGLT